MHIHLLKQKKENLEEVKLNNLKTKTMSRKPLVKPVRRRNIKDPKNQYEQVLYYLYTYSDIDMKFVINDSMFYKFTTRLSELENKLAITLASRTKEKFVNKFGTRSSFNRYSSALPKEKLEEIFIDLNR